MKDLPVDIVVPWVNPSDAVWQSMNKKYSNNPGDNSRQRTRDIGIFKYFFRGIDTNCSWIKRVHLLLACPSQVPAWLNTHHPKLHIVYHNEYIPAEFVPTFNTFVIEAFFHKIPELSENFITCNDDMIFTNRTTRSDYFVGNVSIDNPRTTKYLTCNPVHDLLYHGGAYNMFQQVLDTSTDIEQLITGHKSCYYNYHIPFGLNKSFISFLWHKYGSLFKSKLVNSRFRQPYNFVSWMYRYIKLDMGLYIQSNTIDTDYTYLELGDRLVVDELVRALRTKKVTCLNDMLTLRNERTIGSIVSDLLNRKFPNKCSFEL